MKPKTLKLTAILLIFAGAFTACNGKEYPFLNIETTSITASAESGTFTISVSSNGAWTALVQDAENNSWLALDNSSGMNNGVITVNIAENTLFTPRSAKVKISMGDLSEYVLVEQEAREEPIEIPFTEISWANIECSWTTRVTNELFVINSKEELEKHFDCADGSTFLEIDFSNYTLLFTRGFTPTGSSVDSISFLKVDVEKYVLIVRIDVRMTARPHSWTEAILVPKMPKSTNIERIVIVI